MKEMHTRRTDQQTERKTKKLSIQLRIKQADALSNTSRTTKSIHSAFGYRISLDHATGMEAALACVMRSQQRLRWRQQGLEKQCTEFNPPIITLGCRW